MYFKGMLTGRKWVYFTYGTAYNYLLSDTASKQKKHPSSLNWSLVPLHLINCIVGYIAIWWLLFHSLYGKPGTLLLRPGFLFFSSAFLSSLILSFAAWIFAGLQLKGLSLFPPPPSPAEAKEWERGHPPTSLTNQSCPPLLASLSPTLLHQSKRRKGIRVGS